MELFVMLLDSKDSSMWCCMWRKWSSSLVAHLWVVSIC